MGNNEEKIKSLQAPFDQSDVKYRIQSVYNNQALVLAFVDARALAERLDCVLGPENWYDDYTEWQMPKVEMDPAIPVIAGLDYNGNQNAKAAAGIIEGYYSKAVKCSLSISLDGKRFITKQDGAENTDIEHTKGGFSQAFRRSGAKWGIGRYLYNLPDLWIPISTDKSFGTERIYYKQTNYYFNKPDLTRFTGPVGTDKKVESKSANDAIKNAGNSKTPAANHSESQNTQGKSQPDASVPDGTVPENTEHGGPQAISTTEFRDWQTRAAIFVQGNGAAQQLLAQSAKETDSMTKVSKLLGAMYNVFEPASKEQLAIAEVMQSKQLPEMVTVLKNSLVFLETKGK